MREKEEEEEACQRHTECQRYESSRLRFHTKREREGGGGGHGWLVTDHGREERGGGCFSEYNIDALCENQLVRGGGLVVVARVLHSQY